MSDSGRLAAEKPLGEVAAEIVPEPGWEALRDEVRTGTTLFVGRVGTGKSTLVQWLATELLAGGHRVAVVTCDMGQPMFGVPGAMWATWGPTSRPVAGWFIGDNSPVGNLVPAVAGAAALVGAARKAGCDPILVDTTGLVDGPLGRLLKLHKLHATGAARVVLLDSNPNNELAPLFRLANRSVIQIPPSRHSRHRHWEERREYRDRLFRAYFARAKLQCVPAGRVLSPDWQAGLTPAAARTAPGRLCGLLDAEMYCRALGIVDSLSPGGIFVRTPETDLSWLSAVQLGRLQLGRHGEELRRLDH